MTDETIVLFEDEGCRTFLPLTHTRPVCDLRCGIFTLRERVRMLTGMTPAVICRSHLAQAYGVGRWPLTLLSRSAPLTFVNARALDVGWIFDLLDEPAGTVYLTDAGHALLGGPVLLGARLTPWMASAVLPYLLDQRGAAALAELRRIGRLIEIETRLLTFPWDLIALNGEQIVRDVPLVVRQDGWISAADQPPAHPSIVVSNPAHVFIHRDARLEPPLALDARDGPIVIDAARIEPFSFIQGPAWIGPGSLIASARIRGETSIGPVCRIGGEVEASIVQGYSNKHHDGFLGHSYLGEWVNIGAMTTNSDLKNTLRHNPHGDRGVWSDRQRYPETGVFPRRSCQTGDRGPPERRRRDRHWFEHFWGSLCAQNHSALHLGRRSIPRVPHPVDDRRGAQSYGASQGKHER
jgi:UDP-N-acetylglucosamine diphosphorylase/glucosamine-1-phosphate N-acetyltransferase